MAGIVGYLGHVTMPWDVVGLFTVVAIGGLFAGSHLVGIVSPASLRRGFAVLLMCVGTFVLVQNWHVLAGAASAVSAGHRPGIPEGVMLVRRLYHQRLAQASYLIACTQSAKRSSSIPCAMSSRIWRRRPPKASASWRDRTHVHADFISGSRELAGRTGARLYLSGEAAGLVLYRHVSRRCGRDDSARR